MRIRKEENKRGGALLGISGDRKPNDPQKSN